MISSILVWIFESALGQAILKIIWDDLSSVLLKYIDKQKANKAIDGAAQKSVQPLVDAKTGKDIDAASRDAVDGL